MYFAYAAWRTKAAEPPIAVARISTVQMPDAPPETTMGAATHASPPETQAVTEDNVYEQQSISSTQPLTQRLCTCILTVLIGLFVSVVQLAMTVLRGPSLVCILAAAWAAKFCGGYYHLWVKAWGNAPAALSILRSSSLNGTPRSIDGSGYVY